MARFFAAVSAFFLMALALAAQSWDLGGRAADEISQETNGKLQLKVEFRGRYESREGVNFGKDPDQSVALIHTRVGLTFKPVSWLKLTGTMQDSRAPLYGPNAPTSVRDGADLLESYFELFPDAKKGFGMAAGRAMQSFGEGRLLATAQWGNVTRSFDHARVYYRLPKARLEILAVSPVKCRIGEFNRPVLGERMWGTYDSFPNLFRGTLLETYALRKEQNRPGGFTGGKKADGTDKQTVNTFGFRLAGPVVSGIKYSLEGALQSGKIGPADHKAGAWFSGLSRRWLVGGKKRPLDLSGEYKYASGTKDPKDLTKVGTFDFLYPSNHDKYGHQDLFGWRNMHNPRSLVTLGLTKSFSFNVMYGSFWLASARDAIYNGSGKAIARSAAGTAGRHVGQELAAFGVYKYKHFQLGAGYSYFFKGEFIQRTTPGVNPTYVYLFHTYTL